MIACLGWSGCVHGARQPSDWSENARTTFADHVYASANTHFEENGVFDMARKSESLLCDGALLSYSEQKGHKYK